MNSIWQNIEKNSYPALNKNISVDVLIVGGGLSGITSAYYLNDSNLKIALVEMNKIASGSSAYTTGKINIMQGNTYNDLLNNFGFNKAYKYLKSQLYGLELIKENINKNNINCNFEKTKSIVFTNDKNNIPKINKLKDFFNKANYETNIIYNLPNNYPCSYAIESTGYVFHPLKYLYALADKCKVDIYENTRVTGFEKQNNYYLVHTNNFQIKTKKIIFASNYPFFITPGLIPLKLSTYKSYVLTAKSNNLNFDAISIDEPNKSIRFYENNIIFGGYSHKTAEKINYKNNYNLLKKDFNDNFKIKEEYTWSTTDVKTNDFLPYIGPVTNDIYIITGFNKWGMINSTLAGKIISDLITNKNNEYASLFSFHRALSKEKIKSFFTDSFLISKQYIGGKIKRNKDFYYKSEIVKIDGVNYGVYTDKDGKKHYALNNCPHMGCSLIFNNNDLTWDCPCHASKFDIDGNVLKGPSTENIKKESD